MGFYSPDLDPVASAERRRQVVDTLLLAIPTVAAIAYVVAITFGWLP